MTQPPFHKQEQRFRSLRERFSPFYLWEKLQDIFSGYDYFIAHRSADGKPYAHSLYQRLTQPGIGFRCFIDTKHYPAGGNLLWLQDRALRKATRLIVIVTEQAFLSRESDGTDYLVNEIRQFKLSKNRKSPAGANIIPISTSISVSSSSFQESPLASELPPYPQTLWIVEKPENFLPSSDGPSDLTIAKLINDFTEQKQLVTRSRWLKGFSTVLLVLTIALAGLVLYAFAQRNRALEQEKTAIDQKRSAQTNEAKGWLLQAKLSSNRFPDRAFYAARALGFRGLGFETASTSFRSQPPLIDSALDPKFVSSCLKEVQDVMAPIWSSQSSSVHFTLFSLAVSDVSEWIATGSQEGSLRIWNKRTGGLIREIAAHDGLITKLIALLASGKLVSASVDTTIKIWDVDSGRCDQILRIGEHAVYGLAVSPDESTLYSGDNGGTVLVWNVKTGRRISTLREGPGVILELVLNPTRQVLALCFGEKIDGDKESPENIIEIWDLTSSHLDGALVERSSYLKTIAFSPDGEYLASGSFDGSVKLWDMKTRSVVRTLRGHDRVVSLLSFSKDSGLLLSGGGGGQIVLWNPATGENLRRIDSHSSIIHGLTFVEGGRRVVSADTSGALRLFDLGADTFQNPLRGHSEAITNIAFLRQGNAVLSASKDGAIRFWDFDDGSPVDLLPVRSTIEEAIVSSDQETVYLLTDDSIQEWHLRVRQKIMQTNGEDVSLTEIDSMAISQSGRLLACGGKTKDNKFHIAIFDRVERKLIRTLAGHEGEITDLSFRADDLVISGSSDNTIRTWSLAESQTSTIFKTLKTPPQHLTVDPTGTYVAAGEGDAIHVWYLSGGELTTFKDHQGEITALGFSVDGRWLASGADDNLIGLWDLKNLRRVKMLSGHTEAVTAVAFDRKGRYLLSGAEDHSVKMWDIQNHALSKRWVSLEDSINDFVVRPDSGFAIGVSTKGYVHFWNLSSHLPVDTIHVGVPLRLAATTNDRRLLATTGSDNSVKIWKTAPLTLQRTLTTDYPVRKLEFSDDGLFFQILTGNSISIYETATWKQREGVSGGIREFFDTTFGATGRQSATSIRGLGFNPSQIYIQELDLKQQGASRSLTIPNFGLVQRVALAQQAQLIAFVIGDRVQVWNTQEMNLVASLSDKNSTSAIGMSPKGNLVAYGTTDNQINIWALEESEIQATLAGHGARIHYLTFLEDGKTLVAVDAAKDVLVWDIAIRRPNLAQYFDAGWYEFDPLTGQVQPKRHPPNLFGYGSPNTAAGGRP